VHDCLDILGVDPDAPAGEIRRACARRTSRWHPDFSAFDGSAVCSPPASRFASARLADAAIDFIDMGVVVDRMQRGFFGTS
jgi:curved DNA-binding protein CbpA